MPSADPTLALSSRGPLLTARQVAELLTVSDYTVYRLDMDGTLPAVRIRSALRWHHGDVLAYLEQARGAARPPRHRGRHRKGVSHAR